MNLLLDTHVLLWWLDDNPILLVKAKEAIANGNNMVFVSAVTIWEISIKHTLGKLEISVNFRKILEQQAFEMLSITADHAHLIRELPAHHRDPFDRMLITPHKQTEVEMVERPNKTLPVIFFVVTVCLLLISGTAFSATQGVFRFKGRESAGAPVRMVCRPWPHA